MNSKTQILIVGVVLIGLVSSALGHSYLTSPISRSNQKQSNSGCRGPLCYGPCDAKAASARTPITIARGASVSLQWPRNNHAGGFIRVAWAPTSQSDSHAAFDANIQEIVCHERGGCKPDNANDPNGGDSNPSDGSFLPCQVSITVPPHLTDGLWTLQWAWFGGAFALGDYYSCVDYKIQGGDSGLKPATFFLGGDYSYPGQQKCKFFNTDRLHQCVNEPCDNAVYPSGERSGPAYGFSSTSPPTVPATTGAPVPATTGAAPKPSTTGVKSVTTGISFKPSTTGSKLGTTGAPIASNPDPSSGNCAGLTVPSISPAVITTVDTWGTTLRMIIQITVQEASLANWQLQIIWPSQSTDTKIQAVYNAGVKGCESTTPVNHAMIQPTSWVQTQAYGSILTIEVMASNNNNLSGDYIMSNTQVTVFTS